MQNSPHIFTQCLESWYKKYARDLPWRHTTDPYHIWISEIMLQQTQVDRVKETFYPRFLEVFPSLSGLAKAQWEDLYPVWKGLGYYTRGKNMLRTARLLVDQYEGTFPREKDRLSALPGIGIYTASAILAFAFDQKVPAIDTNIRKIITALYPQEPVDKKAQELVGLSSSGRLWNNAMMDLATTLRQGNVPDELREFFPPTIASSFVPVKKPSQKRKKNDRFTLEIGIACIYKDGKYLIQSRPKGKSFEGMWEFPGGKREKGEDLRGCVKREIQEELGIELSVRPAFFTQMHAFDKINLKLCFHRCQIQKGEPKPLEGQTLQWASPAEFDSIQFLDTNHDVLQKLKKMRM